LFLCENPAGSELFQLAEFVAIWSTGKVGKICFPQCSAGFVSPDDAQILKLTELCATLKNT